MKNKVEVWVVFSTGFRELVFSKSISLPCTPFFGMIIETEDWDVRLDNDNYTTTTTMIGRLLI